MQKKSRNFISNARPRNLYMNKEKRVFKITLLGDLRKRNGLNCFWKWDIFITLMMILMNQLRQNIIKQPQHQILQLIFQKRIYQEY